MIASVVSIAVGFSIDSSVVHHHHHRRHVSSFCQSATSLQGCFNPRQNKWSTGSHNIIIGKNHPAIASNKHSFPTTTTKSKLAPLYSTKSNDEKSTAAGTTSSESTPLPHHTDKELVVGGGEQDILAAFQQPKTSKILSSPIPYSKLTIGIMKETFPGENRVSITPESASVLIKEGFHVVVQSGAGEKASFSDAEYTSKGAIVLPGDQIYANADILTKIRPPTEQEIPKLAGKTLVGMISPSIYPEIYNALAEQNTNVFALDCVPRMLSRAQAYDVLSSQANIAGYRAVVEAAEAFPRFFKGQMTAAGKVPPAKVLVLGAGELCIVS